MREKIQRDPEFRDDGFGCLEPIVLTGKFLFLLPLRLLLFALFVPLSLIIPKLAAWFYHWDQPGQKFCLQVYRPWIEILPTYAEKYFSEQNNKK